MSILNKPLVSIIIPTYRHGHLIERCLQSVMSQTYSNWEAIIIDNHSPDETENIVSGFSDSRIRLLKIHNNGIIAASRNMGICHANGEWISFLDSDDLWYPKKLEMILIEIDKNPAVDVICHNELLFMSENGKKSLLKYGPYEADFYRKMLVYGNRLSTSATTVRREFLEKHNLRFNESSNYVIVEDYDLWLRIASCGGIFHFCEDVLGEYVITDCNISSNTEKFELNLLTLLRDHVFELQSFEFNKEHLWKNVHARFYLTRASNLLKQRKIIECMKKVFCAFNSSFLGSLSCVILRIKLYMLLR